MSRNSSEHQGKNVELIQNHRSENSWRSHLHKEEWIDPHTLSPHPYQTLLYGEDESVDDLLIDIRKSNWIKPLIVTEQDVIISGHRRWKVAILLNWSTVPVERRSFDHLHDEIETLLLENRYRIKTPEQRVREARQWEVLEKQQARRRMSEGARAQKQGCENFHIPDRGRTHDHLAERVGFGSGRTYAKAAEVVSLADTLCAQGKKDCAQTLLQVLNEQSVDAAAHLVQLDKAEQEAVLRKVAQGEQKHVKAALIAVRKEALEAQIQESPSKPHITPVGYETWLNDVPACDLLLTDPPYSTDIEDIEAFAQAWLPLALSKVKPTGRAYVCIGAYPRELRAYLSLETSLPLVQVLAWSYLNTIGPTPASTYKHNWQAILAYRGPEAPPLDCPLLLEHVSAMQISAPDGRQGERYHTWQKPDALAERLIRHATRPSALVLDCFAGTGTFLLAAQRLGRQALGCEPSPHMLALAKLRGCAIDEKPGVVR